VIELADAQARVLAACAPLEVERVALDRASERVCAEDLRAAVDLPPFDRSAMDGFAVRAADTPGRLAFAGDVPAGSVGPELAEGCALAISTGAAIPPGADAVLQSELARLADGSVSAQEAVAPGRHIRRRGEDVRAGDVLAETGERLSLQRISSLAAAGVGEAAVHRVAVVRVVVTGSELLPLGAPAQAGRIHDSNGLTLRLLAHRAGARVASEATVGDDVEATRRALAEGLESDALVVTGGVSVGRHDLVRPVLGELGVEEAFWRVRMRPGKPVSFGVRDRTLVFGLPGNPVSAVVGFLAFVEPALRRLAGERDAQMRTVPARLVGPAAPSGGRTTFLTSRLRHGSDGALEAEPTGRQGSHMTGALGRSDGFVVVSEPAEAGSVVPALVL
jgi:molybdopterin molybdotransferase